MEKLTMAIRLSLGDEVHHVTILRRHPHLVLVIDGEEHEVTRLPGAGDGRGVMSIGGHEVAFARATLGDRQVVRLGGRTFDVSRVDPFSKGGAGGGAQDALKAPMPGAVVTVHRQPGETVARGEPLITIESMKLQTALSAPRDGVVAEILRAEGQTFVKDEVIATLEPETEDA
jgi:3-methylcrotonyl-CoA carboxylase alpha subunit